MTPRPLRAITFLAPNMLPVYQFAINTLSRALDIAITLEVGERYDEVYHADLTFICGLPYLYYSAPRCNPPYLEAVAAPILAGERFQERPIYFSEVIVHAESNVYQLDDLRGKSWAYNEPLSQSGYGITRYTLLQRGKSSGFFGQVIEAGFHQRAIEMVLHREVDAAAIDVQVLAVEYRNNPALRDQLRVIDSFGPSTIQPFAVAAHLPHWLKQAIQTVFIQLHMLPAAQEYLQHGMVDRFVAVTDSDYDDIRAMLAACEAANYLDLA